jgi:GntR family transcriptional repressor for pyruvate dehydrogenase complex
MASTGGTPREFEAIARVSPPEQIRHQIMEAIAEGRYPVGTLLPSERVLCESFGVSRVSVREALAGLEALGVVKIRHGKGAIVQANPAGDYTTPFGEYLKLYRRDIVELLKVRRALDELAASEAAQNVDAKMRRRMREAAKAFKQATQRKPLSLSEVAERDERFHVAVAAASGGKLLPGLIEELNGVLTQSRQMTLSQEGQLERSVREHGLIVDAIIANDAEGAKAAAGDHIRHIVQWLAAEEDSHTD